MFNNFLNVRTKFLILILKIKIYVTNLHQLDRNNISENSIIQFTENFCSLLLQISTNVYKLASFD